MILFGSASIFSALVLVAVVTSLILASRVNDTISNLELHYAAMDSGTTAPPAESHSLPSLTRQIGKLRPITYGIFGGSLLTLFGTLLILVWIDRQRHEQAKQAIASASLAEELRIAEESARERNQELALLFDISGTFAEGGTIEQMSQRIVQRLTVLPGADWVTLRLPDENENLLRLVAAAGTVTEDFPPLVALSSRETQANLAFSSGQPVIVSDYPAEPNASPAIVKLGMKSMALIPIIASGRTLGLVNVISRDAGNFPPERVRIFTTVVDGIGPLFEIARLEGQRRLEQEQLQETIRLSSIGELAAGVAHELNNPLTSVLGYSQMLLDSEIPESVKSSLRIVVSEGQRAAKVIKNLQLFARRSGPEKAFTSVNAVLQMAVDLKRNDFEQSNIKLCCDFDEDVPKTMIDENQVIQVIINILTNAQQSLEESGQQSEGESEGDSRELGQVWISSTSSPGKIRICNEDNGVGIPKDKLGKVFEPFFTTKEVGFGTGLSLSICYGIVKQNGGELWADSIEGRGAIFHIEFPILSEEDNVGKTEDTSETS